MANAKKKCKHCKEFILAESGIKINAGFFCDFDHAVKFGQYKAQEVKQKATKKKNTAQKKAFRLTDTNHQHKLTQAVFNKLRVAEEKQWFSDKGIEPYPVLFSLK